MNSHKLFRTIWRFNALAIACATLLIIAVGIFALYEILKDRTGGINAYQVARVAGEETPVSREELTMGNFSWLIPDKMLWAAVQVDQSYSLGIRSKQANSTRNYLFFDPISGSSNQLFPNNASIITDVDKLCLEKCSKRDQVVRMLVITSISKDINGDRVLSNKDQAGIGLASPDGTDFVDLQLEIDALLSANLLGQDQILLIIDKSGNAEAIYVNLNDYKITRRVKIG